MTFSIQAKADSWVDPSWKEMLDSSEVIALIQYTSNGDFRASAKILNIYKGQLKIGDEIWVSGFSNRYGPIDKMKTGDKYLVFLNLSQPTEKRIEYWNAELLKKPELKEYVEALKTKKAFYVSLINAFEQLITWNEAAIEATFNEVVAHHGIKKGDVMLPFRIMLVGGKFGPGVFAIADLITKENCIKRIQNALQQL